MNTALAFWSSSVRKVREGCQIFVRMTESAFIAIEVGVILKGGGLEEVGTCSPRVLQVPVPPIGVHAATPDSDENLDIT